MTDRPTRIMLERAARKGWMISYHMEGQDDAPVSDACSDEWDTIVALCEVLGIPLPQVQERPSTQPASGGLRMPKLLRGGKE